MFVTALCVCVCVCAAEPLWYFGYGESYATFAYTNITTNVMDIHMCDSVTVRAVVSNAPESAFAADEVVQVYVVLAGTRSVAPRIDLVAFTRLYALPYVLWSLVAVKTTRRNGV